MLRRHRRSSIVALARPPHSHAPSAFVALFLMGRRGPLPTPSARRQRALRAPSVVVGLFAYSLVVHPHPLSAYSAGLALAVLMLPVVVRGDEEDSAHGPFPASRRPASRLSARRSRVVRFSRRAGWVPMQRDGRPAPFTTPSRRTAPLLFTAHQQLQLSGIPSLSRPWNTIPIMI